MWSTAGTPNFEALTVANWANYVITMTETPSASYFYSGTFPAITENMVSGFYWIDIFKQLGGSAAISDTIVGGIIGYWNGTIFSPWDANLTTWLGTTPLALSNQYIQSISIDALAILSGVVNTVSDNGDFTLTSTDLSTNNDDYNGMWLIFTSGNNKGICRIIGDYVGAGKQVIFNGTGRSGAFPQTVTPADTFLIMAGIP